MAEKTDSFVYADKSTAPGSKEAESTTSSSATRKGIEGRIVRGTKGQSKKPMFIVCSN